MAVPITPTISVFPSDVQDPQSQPSNGYLTASNAPSFGSKDPPTNRILILPGDHVGPEVMAEALKLLGILEDALGHKFEAIHDLCGGCSIDKYGVPITDAVLKKASEVDAILFGSVGGPEWGTTQPNPESGLLRLRQHVAAFANIRPCTFYSRSLVERSPLKREVVDGVDFVILRENCGGAYYGMKIEDQGDGYASDTWEYSRKEVERCAHVAAALAKTMGKDGKDAAVWSADKANVLASGRLWRKVVSETFANHYPEMQLRHQLADSLSMLMMQDPRRFNGVVLTDNTFGDMLSDQAGGVVGTLGLLPSASLCGVPGEGRRCNGIYEPVHGSAPDVAGKGIVNPVAQILSTALMLRYSFNMHMEAELVEKAVEKVLDAKDIGGLELRTADLGGTASTSEVGDAVCSVLRDMLGDVRGGIPKRNRLSSLLDMGHNTDDRPRTVHSDQNARWKAEISKLPREEFTSLAL